MPLIDPTQLQTLLGAVVGRFDVDSIDACDSSNSELMRRAIQGAPSGSTLVADQQSAGRGRRGREWFSSPEDSLTFSLLWRFDGNASRLAGLSLAVGVAVAQALTKLGVAGVGLKWPNDVLLSGGKLAGILVELSSERRGTLAVIGIGLNLRQPSKELPQASSGLADACNPPPDRHRVLAELLIALAAVLDRFAHGGFADLQTSWQSHHAWQGKPVRVVLDDHKEICGRCLGADADGALLLESETGVQRFLSGDISLRSS